MDGMNSKMEEFLMSATASAKSKLQSSNDQMSAEAFKNDPELDKMIQEFAVKMAQTGAPAQADRQGHSVLPLPGYVVKTKLEEAYEDYPAGMKVFINICHSPEIPAPPLCSKAEIQKAIKADDTTTYRVPLSLSPCRTDMDKSKKMCLVFDSCINSTPFEQAMEDDDFQLFIMELAVEWVEEKHHLKLSRGTSV
jgi:PIH1 N-terminal domain